MYTPTSSRRTLRRGIAGGFALLALAGVLTACGGDDVTADKDRSTTTTTAKPSSGGATNPTGGVARTSWKLASPADGTDPTLDFAPEGIVSGSTGCNRFNGTWTEDGDSLKIALGPMTQMACTSDAATQQEKSIIDSLAKVASAEQTATTLVLKDSDGKELLTYDAVTGDLRGTSWKVNGVNTGNAVETSALTEALTLDFGTEGSVTGFGGCNNFRGSYTLEGGVISFSEFASTKKACEPDVMELEDKYLAALAAASVVERSGNTLNLRDDKGATQVAATLAG
ncbi:MAG TPA: META domain-containing protein [Microthrixaceae bacterium]|nr:META domain-containing protein [Microthrixaceae bacterium]HNJ68658.1 META domain-containing protein [Microthrixaceae bacterium]HNL49163.1 META domain-containing protein [Microthrixaceae bacterium]